MPTKIISPNDRYGRLTVIQQVPNEPGTHCMYLVVCDCGNRKTIRSSVLRSGRTISCGCYQRETAALVNRTHGMSRKKVPEYHVWRSMLDRCSNPKLKNYHNYGGRGIVVCQLWRDSFLAFYKDMGLRPSPSHVIDRKDNDGNYEPSNCRWATRRESANNRRTNVPITINGTTKNAAEWSSESGISRHVIVKRFQNGWPEDQLLIPVKLRGGGPFGWRDPSP